MKLASLKKSSFFLYCLSWVIVAFGQPAWCSWLSPVAASVGFALFWVSVHNCTPFQRFGLAIGWFFCVEGVHLSWLTATQYQGYYILGVYVTICFVLSLSFAFVTAILFQDKLTRFYINPYQRVILAASLWTLLEWLRLFVLCGFSWDPIGLALTDSIYSLQMASIWGIYGLSFWVFLINGLGYRLIICVSSRRGCQKKQLMWIGAWSMLAISPYLYGYGRIESFGSRMDTPSSLCNPTTDVFSLNVALVQTGILPSQKVLLPGKEDEYILPFDQWKAIFSSLISSQSVKLYTNNLKNREFGKAAPQELDKNFEEKPTLPKIDASSCLCIPPDDSIDRWDLIVLPEAVVPLCADTAYYPYSQVVAYLQDIYGKEVVGDLPPVTPLLAKYRSSWSGCGWHVSNIYLAQAIANIYHADVVIGLDYLDRLTDQHYNSAFYLTPQQKIMDLETCRYDKQILLPLAEYLPFKALKTLTQRYGITNFFSHGVKNKIFNSKVPLSVSVCYEETFPHLIRKSRLLGAQLFINLTNDSYYPFSKLAQQHFDHGRVRAVENGVPLLRACNTGITAYVDCLGREMARLDCDHLQKGVLSVSVPQASVKTVYMIFGDGFIVIFCIVLIGGGEFLLKKIEV